MTLESQTASLREHVGMAHSEQAIAEHEENVGRNTVATNEFKDLSSWQGAGSWIQRTYNVAGEELSFVRENGCNTHSFYYGPYKTTLRNKGFDFTYPEAISHRLSGVSLDTCVSLDYSQGEDGDIKHFNVVASDAKGFSFEASRVGVRVTIYRDHPNYDSYDYPEEEVEPSPEGSDPVMGKEIFIKL